MGAELIRRGATGGPGRLVLIFALSVLLPSLALAALAWRSVEKERRALSAERRSGLQRAAILMRRELIGSVEKMRAFAEAVRQVEAESAPEPESE